MSLSDSFTIESYVQVTSGLTSPSELISNEIVIFDLSTQPTLVSFTQGTIILNDSDVGTTASVNNNDNFKLKVINPVVGQTTNYSYLIDSTLTLQWEVVLYDSATQNPEITHTGGTTDINSYSLPIHTFYSIPAVTIVPIEEVG